MKTLSIHLFIFLLIANFLSAQNCLLVPNQYDPFTGQASIDGSTAIIGEPNYYSTEIKILSETGGVWTADQIITNPDTNAISFGGSIDLSGDYAIVGADNTAFFLKKTGGNWIVQQQVFHDNPSSFSAFGAKVKIDGDIAIVSAQYDSDLYSYMGAVYVYKRDASDTWNQVQKLYPSGQTGNNYFGDIIDLKGSRIIAACGNYSSYLSGQDAVFVYEEDASGIFIETQQIDEPLGLSYLGSLALSSNQLAITGAQTFFYELDGSGQFTHFQTVPIQYLLDLSDSRAAFQSEDYDYNTTTSLWELAQDRGNYSYYGEISGDRMIASGLFYSCDANLCYARLSTYNSSLTICSAFPEASYPVEIGGGTGPFTLGFDTDEDGIADDVRTGVVADSVLTFTFVDTTVLTLVSALDESNGNFMCSVTGSLVFNFVDSPDLVPMGTIMNSCPVDFVDLTALSYTDNNPVSAVDTNAYYSYRYINGQLILNPDKVCASGYVVVTKVSQGCSDRDTVFVDLQDCGTTYCSPSHSQWVQKTYYSTLSASGDFLIVGQDRENNNSGIATLYHQDANGTWIEIEEFAPSEGAVPGTDNDYFGRTVSIDGDYLAIAAYGDDDQGGAVYMYEKSGSTFVFVEKLLGGSNFGYHLKLSGDEMVVANTGSYGSTVYERNASGNWIVKQTLSVGGYRYFFGQSIEFNDEIIALSSLHNSRNDSLYVFEKDGSGTYVHEQSIPSPVNNSYSYYGNRTAVSNNRIATTLPGTSSEGVYIYEKDASGTWINMDTISALLQNDNDVALVDDTLFVSYNYPIDQYIYDGVSWDLKKSIFPHEGGPGYSRAMDYENGNLWTATFSAVEYLTCADYDCLAQFSIEEYQNCDTPSNIPIRIEISMGNGPYTIEIDTTGDGLTDWTVNDYYSGSTFYDQPIGIDTFTYDLISVIDNGNNSEVCRLGKGLIYIVNPTPDLSPVPPQTNACPSGTFDLTAVTLVDNNPASSAFAAEYSYALVGSSTPIADPTQIEVDGIYRITKSIGYCSDYVEFLVDVLNCPGNLCNLQPSGIFYPDTLAANTRFSNFEFDGTTVVARRQYLTGGADLLYIYEKDINGYFVILDTIVEPAASANFGFRYKVSGDYIAVGDNYDSTNGTNTGAVYMYKKDAGSGLWNFDSKLIGSDAGVGDYFGVDVDLEGNRMVATSKDYNSGIRGAIYVFELNGSGTWVEIDKSIPMTTMTNSIGNNVELDGDFIAVGDTGYNGTGGVCLFKDDGSGNWIEHQVIVPTNGGPGDFYSRNMSFDSGILVVGSRQNDFFANNAGAVYIYEEDSGGQFAEEQVLHPPAPVSNSYFGNDVSISGDRLVVTEPNSDVRVYTNSGVSWTEEQYFDVSGSTESVRISGDDLLVGIINFHSANSQGGAIRSYSCEPAVCAATIYGNRASCNITTYFRFEAYGGLGPYLVELDADGDGIADAVTQLNNNSLSYLNVTEKTTFDLLAVTDIGTGNEICNVYGSVTLDSHNLDPGEITSDQEICSGDNAAVLNYSTLPTATTGIGLWRWYKRTASTNWSLVATNGSTYDPGVLTETTFFRAQAYANVYFGSGCNRYTDQITIFVGDTASPEICDGFDNDCNGLIDDGLALYTYYQDSDNDGFGDINITIDTCLAAAPIGWVVNDTDCNDNCNSCYPGAIDYCNNIDEDCDGIAMENCNYCPDIEITSITIDTVITSTNRVEYTAVLTNVGVDTVFMSQRGLQHWYSDDNIIFNGDEFGAGGWGSNVFGIDTVPPGQGFSYSLYSTNFNFINDPTPHIIIDITGFDCQPANNIVIQEVVCSTCPECDYDIAIINNDIIPVDTFSDYIWSANQYMIMYGSVLSGSGADTLVDLTARNHITLGPGFEAKLGTNTHVYTQGCDPVNLPVAPPQDEPDSSAKAINQNVETKGKEEKIEQP